MIMFFFSTDPDKYLNPGRHLDLDPKLYKQEKDAAQKEAEEQAESDEPRSKWSV